MVWSKAVPSVSSQTNENGIYFSSYRLPKPLLKSLIYRTNPYVSDSDREESSSSSDSEQETKRHLSPTRGPTKKNQRKNQSKDKKKNQKHRPSSREKKRNSTRLNSPQRNNSNQSQHRPLSVQVPLVPTDYEIQTTIQNSFIPPVIPEITIERNSASYLVPDQTFSPPSLSARPMSVMNPVVETPVHQRSYSISSDSPFHFSPDTINQQESQNDSLNQRISRKIVPQDEKSKKIAALMSQRKEMKKTTPERNETSPSKRQPSPTSTTTTTMASTTSQQDEIRILLVNELISTERTYIYDLTILLTEFMDPIQTQELLTPKQSLEIFGTIQTILQFSRNFLARLESKTHSSSSLSSLRVGEIMLKHLIETLHFYESYSVAHTHSLQLIQSEKKQNPMFSAFLGHTLSLPVLCGQSLESYLLKPLKRVCIYPEILRELISQTVTLHVDYEDLCEALSRIEQVSGPISKELLEKEGASKIKWLTKNIKSLNDLEFDNENLKFLGESNFQVKVIDEHSSEDPDFGHLCSLVFFDCCILVIKKTKLKEFFSIPLKTRSLLTHPEYHQIIKSCRQITKGFIINFTRLKDGQKENKILQCIGSRDNSRLFVRMLNELLA